MLLLVVVGTTGCRPVVSALFKRGATRSSTRELVEKAGESLAVEGAQRALASSVSLPSFALPSPARATADPAIPPVAAPASRASVRRFEMPHFEPVPASTYAPPAAIVQLQQQQAAEMARSQQQQMQLQMQRRY